MPYAPKMITSPMMPPHDGSLPVGSLRFISSSLDEFKHAPKEEDKSCGREKQDKRIDYLYDDAPEKLIENGWNLPTIYYWPI